MSDGENPNGVSPNEIGDIVRKDFEVDSAVTLGPEAGQFRIEENPVDHPASFLFQAEAQTCFNSFVIRNGFVQFVLRLLEDLKVHEG